MKNRFKTIFFVLACFAVTLACANDQQKADALYNRGKISEALEIYLKPENRGNPRVQNRIGIIYSQGGFRDNQKAVEWFRKAAKQGDHYSQYNLGLAYKNGEGVKQDYARAMELFQQAAAQGNGSAMNAIAILYEDGLGVKEDQTEAFRWYGKASANGSDNALCNAAGIFMHSKENKNYKQAQILLVNCLRRTSDNTCCLNRMADLYASGWGVERDTKKVRELREKSAALGSSVAMYNLGVYYDYGIGVKKAPQTAMDWYLKAAAKDNARAMHRLYEVYEYGKLGQPVDKAKAAEWKAKAEKAIKEQGLSRNELMDSFRLVMEASEN